MDARNIGKRLFRIARGFFSGIDSEKVETTHEKNLTYLKCALRKEEPVVVINSYPRSGNTWLRQILSDIFLQKEGFETETNLPVDRSLIIPDIYVSLLANRDPRVNTLGIFLKTHEPIDSFYKLFPVSRLKKIKYIYIYRRPEDALVSYFHFNLKYGDEQRKHDLMQEGIDSFCLGSMHEWRAHTSGYLDAWKKGEKIFFLSYEDLTDVPDETVLSLCRWLKIDADQTIVSRAISNSQFRNLRRIEEISSKQTTGEFFFRKGVKGSGKNELKDATLSDIKAYSDKIIKDLFSTKVKVLSDQSDPSH